MSRCFSRLGFALSAIFALTACGNTHTPPGELGALITGQTHDSNLGTQFVFVGQVGSTHAPEFGLEVVFADSYLESDKYTWSEPFAALVANPENFKLTQVNSDGTTNPISIASAAADSFELDGKKLAVDLVLPGLAELAPADYQLSVTGVKLDSEELGAAQLMFSWPTRVSNDAVPAGANQTTVYQKGPRPSP